MIRPLARVVLLSPGSVDLGAGELHAARVLDDGIVVDVRDGRALVRWSGLRGEAWVDLDRVAEWRAP